VAVSGRPNRVAGPLRLWSRRLWSRVSEPFVRWRRSRRTRRRRRSVEGKPSWHRSSLLVRVARIVTLVAAAFFLLWLLRAALAVGGEPWNLPFDLDKACGDTGFSCEALSGTLVPIFSIALASALFLFYRLSQVHKPYVRTAQEKPQEVVLTAGRIIGDVVGRDELCHVIIQDLRDRDTRRPHVVIGGVGTGKTALLVRLTKLLAERGVVPVPVRLRDAQSELDFRELARRRFVNDADAALLSDAEGEKIWRQLCKDDRVVVLADGLEETLIEGDAEKERDTLIRLAIRRANDTGLPLIIASRPHDPLRGMEAAIVELEPLSEEAALDYVQRGGTSEDEHRLDWIVETAEVSEMPLYLQVTGQLHRAGLLDYVSPSREGEWLDIRSVDRAALRLGLLEVWTRALIDGHFPPGLALSREERVATVEQLSALACIGLKQDRLHVGFDDLEPSRTRTGSTAPGSEATKSQAPWARASLRLPLIRRDPAARPHPAINLAVERKLGRRLDLRLAATWGTQLGLVEAFRDGVRFPHSIMQAYLGSRLIDVAMADEAYRATALADPGRELLIALVLHSRAEAQKLRSNAASRARTPRRGGNRRRHRELLRQAARHRSDVKALNLYAAALEVDSADDAPAHHAIAEELQARWRDIAARDLRTLEEAKLNLVRRFGEAARQITERRWELARPVKSAYKQLYRISSYEPSYPIRLAAAQEIGSGGDEAYGVLEGCLGPPGRQTTPRPTKGLEIRRTVLRGRVGARRTGDDADQEERSWREGITRAWLAPQLVGSTTRAGRASDARDHLEQWLALVGGQQGGNGESGLRLSFEVALAQGFKTAANRRREHPHARREARAYLVERAREMLRGTSFWFSRLTLLHALCLWSLPDGPAGQRSSRGHDAEPSALVAYWAAVPGGGPEHPFVAEARTLVVWALETGQPERFIWIDESGVVARVGSRPASPDVRRKHNLWIPPSTGWTALHPRALRLVADVLLLLNLAERGGRPIDRERRLQRTNRNDLPPCLAGERYPLDPSRTVGTTTTSEPGSNCKPGCRFELCPYPPKSEGSYRVELSEAFCRSQQALFKRTWVRRAAPWQEVLPRDLRRFWKQMGQRAQPGEFNHEHDGEHARRRAHRGGDAAASPPP
jgi:NACHT domain-containing protein